MSLNLNYVRVIPFSLYLLLRYEIIWHADEFKSVNKSFYLFIHEERVPFICIGVCDFCDGITTYLHSSSTKMHD